MDPAQPLSRRTLLAGALALPLAAACSRTAAGPGDGSPSAAPTAATTATSPAAETPSGAPASTAELASRATVPVLCWHQLRDWRPDDGSYARQLLICPPAQFRAQLDALAEDGWTTIGPDQYLAHLETGAALPDKPVILSFDDAQGTQASEGLPQLLARKMTGTFFVMTVVLDKPDWLSHDDLRRIDAAGMTVAAHTFDHHRVDRYAGTDWATQLDQPRELLERIVGKPVEHFAYPYGAWNEAAFPHLASAGYRTAFQLSDKPLDPGAPRQTLRRVLMSSTWTGPELLTHLRP